MLYCQCEHLDPRKCQQATPCLCRCHNIVRLHEEFEEELVTWDNPLSEEEKAAIYKDIALGRLDRPLKTFGKDHFEEIVCILMMGPHREVLAESLLTMSLRQSPLKIFEMLSDLEKMIGKEKKRQNEPSDFASSFLRFL